MTYSLLPRLEDIAADLPGGHHQCHQGAGGQAHVPTPFRVNLGGADDSKAKCPRATVYNCSVVTVVKSNHKVWGFPTPVSLAAELRLQPYSVHHKYHPSCRNLTAAMAKKTPNWLRSWANFSLLSLYSHRHAWANLYLLGQPKAFLAAAMAAAMAQVDRPA